MRGRRGKRGRKRGRRSHPCPLFPQLTAMCFDKNERRLVTAGGDGRVLMWNFNNGSKLREYAHGDEEMEIVQVSSPSSLRCFDLGARRWRLCR